MVSWGRRAGSFAARKSCRKSCRKGWRERAARLQEGGLVYASLRRAWSRWEGGVGSPAGSLPLCHSGTLPIYLINMSQRLTETSPEQGWLQVLMEQNMRENGMARHGPENLQNSMARHSSAT